MTVKELVSSHARVRSPRNDIIVTVSLFKNKDDEPYAEFTPDEIINSDYKDYIAKAWYQTSGATNNGVLIDISILI